DAIDAVFRSQQVWDATMAASVVDGLDQPGTDRVVHLIGRFHSDLEGGTIVEIRKRRPDSDILVVSCVRTSSPVRELDAEDLGRGDVVVYTPEDPGAE
ncbi:MAG: ChaN family lipoprotein, partial [Phycisphaeraceae bacterium]|nr:ChaN family lipoprotein [Phycisphaeraceae bacterium]